MVVVRNWLWNHLTVYSFYTMKPKISFTFPFRFLKEDRKYLAKNLVRMVGGSVNTNVYDSIQVQNLPRVYIVILEQYAYQPKGYKLTKEEITEIFEKVLWKAECVELRKMFVQKSKNQGLPVMNMKIYY